MWLFTRLFYFHFFKNFFYKCWIYFACIFIYSTWFFEHLIFPHDFHTIYHFFLHVSFTFCTHFLIYFTHYYNQLFYFHLWLCLHMNHLFSFQQWFFFFFTNDSFVLYMTFFHIWIFLCDCVFSQNDLFDVFMYFTCFLHDYFFTCDFCTVHDFLKLFVHFILTCNFYTLLHNSFLFMWLFFYIP